MTTLSDLAARAAFDPLVRSALIAAAVLAIASLLGGAVRRDLSALLRPAGAAALAAALLAALGLSAAGSAAAGGAPEVARWVDGPERLPLYLLALGYGPGVGMVAALAWSATTAGPWLADVADARLALEALVVGWLALAPSPRRRRWAAPLAVLAGWAMATATLGLAAAAHDGAAASWSGLARAHAGSLVVASATALVAAAPPRGWWRRRVPGAAPAVLGSAPHDAVRWLRPLAPPDHDRRAARPHPDWPAPPAPPALQRARRARSRFAPVLSPGPLQRGDATEPSGLRRR